MVIPGLISILLVVLVLPFAVHKVEENLEIFLFVMGLLAVSISGKLNTELAIKALEEPWKIALAVLLAGALFFVFQKPFSDFMEKVFQKVPVAIVVFLVVFLLGLLSSVITAIVASIILVEIIFLLPMQRNQKIIVCVLSCYSIGLGAALTPIGEPLSTIAISKLNQEFFYLLNLLGKFIVPAVIGFSLIAAVFSFLVTRSGDKGGELAASIDGEEGEIEADTWKGIVIRALKVYLFVMALVFLGDGFEPLIEEYILELSPNLLYWVNTVSAVLDNATLAAAEISPQMNSLTVEAILMGLLISGGMLIPGNIPNIISASKLKITSSEWAKIGLPIGLVVLGVFYLIMF